MDNQNENKPIEEAVLSAIKSGRVKMRPRWHFVLRTTLLSTWGVLLLLVLLYLVSFIVFTLRQTGVWFEPSFGSTGWFAFFRSLPWLLVLLCIFFIIILEILVRHYSFAYRKPLLYSVLGIMAIAIVGGTAAAPLHRLPFRSARENTLPFAGPFYRDFGMQQLSNVHRGVITRIMPGGFVLEDVRGATSTVVLNPQTRVPPGSDFAPGDTVVVFGNETDGQIQAYGVQEISE